jgi:hypothetical protein
MEPRRFPHPYRAMLAISTDIDATTMEAFRETHRFMNTLEQTSMGPGVGLDVANSFWVYGRGAGAEPTLFAGSSWKRPAPMADEVLHYLRCGWIDTLHSYGPFTRVFTREHAERALDLLSANDVRLRVWTNHGGQTNLQNLNGPAYKYRTDDARTTWQGDVWGTEGYHADLLLEYGVRFAWQYGRESMQFGLTRLLEQWELANGSPMWGFPRNSAEASTPEAEAFTSEHGLVVRTSRAGRRWLQLWHPEYLPRQLAPEKLDKIVRHGWAVIIAQHLGVLRGETRFPPATIDALRRLKAYEDENQILVTTVGRLVRYEQVRDHLELAIVEDGERIIIDLARVADPLFGAFVPTLDDVRGVTLHVADPDRVQLTVAGMSIPAEEIVRAAAHGRAEPSIGVRWFERDVSDYTTGFGRS